MSFWKKAGELAAKTGSVITEQVRDANERTKQYKTEMPSKSDSELAKILNKERSRSPLKASAAYQELKSRGFSPEEIKNL